MLIGKSFVIQNLLFWFNWDQAPQFEMSAMFQSLKSHDPKASIISDGLYSIHIKEWLKYGFNQSQILIINGEEFSLNPSKIILAVQHFIGLAPVIKEENFKLNDDNGLLCFVNITREIDCLSEKIGQDSFGLNIGCSFAKRPELGLLEGLRI